MPLMEPVEVHVYTVIPPAISGVYVPTIPANKLQAMDVVWSTLALHIFWIVSDACMKIGIGQWEPIRCTEMYAGNSTPRPYILPWITMT